jgi:hypothetical protein
MYDLEIMIPAELNNPTLSQRFKDYKKYGLLNTANVQIKLIFAASHNNKIVQLDELCSGWPENIHAEYLLTPYTQVAQRIHYYYTDYMQPNTADWYIRMDEDSMTDICGLMENLYEMFDPEMLFYITGELRREKSFPEGPILENMGYGRMYKFDLDSFPPHEHEASIVSRKAIERILNNQDSMTLLNIRKEISDGPGDHGLCLAAQLAKVYPYSVGFMTCEPKLHYFSNYGGFINHIHHISRDLTPEMYNWVENQTDIQPPVKNYFLNRDGRTYWISLENKRITEIMENEKKIIGVWNMPNEHTMTLIMDYDVQVLKETRNGFANHVLSLKNTPNVHKNILL